MARISVVVACVLASMVAASAVQAYPYVDGWGGGSKCFVAGWGDIPNEEAWSVCVVVANANEDYLGCVHNVTGSGQWDGCGCDEDPSHLVRLYAPGGDHYATAWFDCY